MFGQLGLGLTMASFIVTDWRKTLANEQYFPIARAGAMLGQTRPNLTDGETESVFVYWSALPDTYEKYVIAKNASLCVLAPRVLAAAVQNAVTGGYWDNGVFINQSFSENGTTTYQNNAFGSVQLGALADERYTLMKSYAEGVEWAILATFMRPDNLGWIKAVDSYNATGWSGNLVYQSVIEVMQGYYKQGQADRGTLKADLAYPYYVQRVQDNKPSAGQAFISAVVFALVSFGFFSAVSAANAAGGVNGIGTGTTTTIDTGAQLYEVTTPLVETAPLLPAEGGLTLETVEEVIAAGGTVYSAVNKPQVKPPIAAPALTTAQLQAQALAQAQNSSKSAYVLGGAALLGLVFLKLAIL